MSTVTPDDNKVYYVSVNWEGDKEVLEGWFDLAEGFLTGPYQYPLHLYVEYLVLKNIALDPYADNEALLMAGSDVQKLLELPGSIDSVYNWDTDHPGLNLEPVTEKQWDDVLKSAKLLIVDKAPKKARRWDADDKMVFFTGFDIRFVANGPRGECIMNGGTLQEDYGNMVLESDEYIVLIDRIIRSMGLENIELMDGWQGYKDMYDPDTGRYTDRCVWVEGRTQTYEKDMSEDRVYFRSVPDHEWLSLYKWALENEAFSSQDIVRHMNLVVGKACGDIKELYLAEIDTIVQWKETIKPAVVDAAVNLHKMAVDMGFEVSEEDKNKVH